MQARCPQCGQVFTTDGLGLRNCPACGIQVQVGLSVTPAGGAEGAGPSASGRAPTPWEQRASIGWLAGFWRTWKQTILHPQAFWATVEPNGRWTDALLYSWILAAVGIAVDFPVSMRIYGPLVLSYMGTLGPSFTLPGGSPDEMMTLLSRSTLASYGLTAIIYPLLAAVAAAVLHLSCIALGVARHGYEATLRAVCYSMAPLVLSFIPLFSMIVFPVWWVLLFGLGIASLQGSTPGRAMAAVLIPPLMLLCCCMGGTLLLYVPLLLRH